MSGSGGGGGLIPETPINCESISFNTAVNSLQEDTLENLQKGDKLGRWQWVAHDLCLDLVVILKHALALMEIFAVVGDHQISSRESLSSNASKVSLSEQKSAIS
jgi:hypothetical protein